MLKPIKETEILKRYSNPSGDPPSSIKQSPSGGISIFPLSPLGLPLETFKNALKRRDANQQVLIQWIKKNLHPDVDYGRIHVVEQCQYARAGVSHQCCNLSHMSMITLWKAGSEKILNIMGLSVHFPNLHQYELAAVHKQEITQVVLKCELRTQNGQIVAEGTGSRDLKQDGWLIHKALKMATKSAMIDATIRVAGLTGIFLKTHRHTVKNNLPSVRHRLNKTSHCIPAELPITDKQKHLIQIIAGHQGLTIEALDKQANSLFSKGLSGLDRVQASRFIQHLKG